MKNELNFSQLILFLKRIRQKLMIEKESPIIIKLDTVIIYKIIFININFIALLNIFHNL